MESLRNEVFTYVLEQYGVEPDYPFPKDSNSGVLRHLNSQKWFAIVMQAPKRYLGTGAEGHEDVITMKCDPMLIDTLIQKDGYYRAYHMNKQQWISIRLDGSVPMDKIYDLVDLSFELTDKTFRKNVGQIRKMERSDIERVMKIWLNTNIEAHPFVNAQYWKSNFNYVKDAILEAEVYVYEKDERICGFVGVMDTFIAGLFVEKKMQGKGIGTALIRHLQTCKEELQLNVYVKNEKAAAIYKNQGFTITSTAMDETVGQEEHTMKWCRLCG